VKYIKRVTALSIILPFHLHSKKQELEISITPEWKRLDNNIMEADIEELEDAWILAGEIHLKKNTKESVYLNDEIVITWKGKPLDNLFASLYKRPLGKPLIPIEKHMICDSIWNRRKQQLIFKIPEPMPLDHVNSLCLVLTLPTDKESLIKQGSFQIEQHSLPYPFQHCFKKNTLSFAFNTLR